MKKYLLVLLFCCFWLLYAHNALWSVVPPVFGPTGSQEACPIIINPNLIDWFKLVSVSWFDWDVEDVNSFWCTIWYVFLVPEDLDVSTIKTVEWPMEIRKEYPGHVMEIRDHLTRKEYFTSSWTTFLRTLENDNAKFVWSLFKRYYYNIIGKERPSHVLKFYSLELQNDWEFWLEDYYSINYELYYIYCIIWWIILVCWVVYYIKRKKRNTWDKVE